MQVWPFLYLVSGALALTVFAFYMQLRIGYSNSPNGSFTASLDKLYDIAGIGSGIASIFLLAYGILPFVMKISPKLKMAWMIMTLLSVGTLSAGMYYILTYSELNQTINELNESIQFSIKNSQQNPYLPVYQSMLNILKNGPYLLGSSAGLGLLAGIMMIL